MPTLNSLLGKEPEAVAEALKGISSGERDSLREEISHAVIEATRGSRSGGLLNVEHIRKLSNVSVGLIWSAECERISNQFN